MHEDKLNKTNTNFNSNGFNVYFLNCLNKYLNFLNALVLSNGMHLQFKCLWMSKAEKINLIKFNYKIFVQKIVFILLKQKNNFDRKLILYCLQLNPLKTALFSLLNVQNEPNCIYTPTFAFCILFYSRMKLTQNEIHMKRDQKQVFFFQVPATLLMFHFLTLKQLKLKVFLLYCSEL